MYVRCISCNDENIHIDIDDLYCLNTDAFTGRKYILCEDGKKLYILKSNQDGLYYTPGYDCTFSDSFELKYKDDKENECMIKDMPVKAQRIIAIKHGDEWRDIGFAFDRIESTEKTITLICTMRYRGYSGEMNIDSDVIVRWG